VDLTKFQELARRILPNIPETIVPQLFKVMDRNKDGILTTKEFMLGIAALSKGNLTKKAKLCFACFDKDHNGTLDQHGSTFFFFFS